MNKPMPKVRNPQIVREAADWFVEFSAGDGNARKRKAFDAWIRQSPEHIRAYLEMFPLWEDTARVDSGHAIDTDELIQLALRSPTHAMDFVTPLPQVHRASGRRPLRQWMWAAAAAVAFVALSGAVFWYQSQRSSYVTHVGEQRHIDLPDGSTIELNARSRLRVQFTERERSIELIDGQAWFKVAQDLRRPFVVSSGDTQVRAIGTQFDVYRRHSATTVTVVEGKVSAATTSSNPVLLTAGQQLTVRSSELAAPTRVDVAAATAWRRRQVVFSSTPLTQVAEEFNRYNERRLVVGDPELAAFNVSGVFSSSDLPSFLRFLRAQPNIAVTESADEIRIDAH